MHTDLMAFRAFQRSCLPGFIYSLVSQVAHWGRDGKDAVSTPLSYPVSDFCMFKTLVAHILVSRYFDDQLASVFKASSVVCFVDKTSMSVPLWTHVLQCCSDI